MSEIRNFVTETIEDLDNIKDEDLKQIKSTLESITNLAQKTIILHPDIIQTLNLTNKLRSVKQEANNMATILKLTISQKKVRESQINLLKTIDETDIPDDSKASLLEILESHSFLKPPENKDELGTTTTKTDQQPPPENTETGTTEQPSKCDNQNTEKEGTTEGDSTKVIQPDNQ